LARHFLGTIRTPELISAVRDFHHRLGRPVILILDRLHVHRSHETQAFVARHAAWFTLEWLLSYAPVLNPDELCNGWVKRDTLKALPVTDEELRQHARRSFRRLGGHPEVLRGFVDHAGLSVT
jgi:hypothetical protein